MGWHDSLRQLLKVAATALVWAAALTAVLALAAIKMDHGNEFTYGGDIVWAQVVALCKGMYALTFMAAFVVGCFLKAFSTR